MKITITKRISGDRHNRNVGDIVRVPDEQAWQLIADGYAELAVRNNRAIETGMLDHRSCETR
jgi:hypothetical protein